MDHTYIVIMAGGKGTRLWPLSRKDHPKQFQLLTSEQRTLLQETYDRVLPLVTDTTHLFVATIEQYVPIVREQLPHILPENILIEPCGRDTAPAIALTASIIAQRDPDAIIVTTTSDHAISNPDEYILSVQTACDVLADYPQKFGLIGITPTESSTELGYIHTGRAFAARYAKPVFTAKAFKEKPDRATAEKYLQSSAYLWNAAYFVFTASAFLEMVKKHTPHISAAITKMRKTTDPKKRHKIFCALPKEPIDTVILEKLAAKERFVVPSQLIWSDVGNWRTLHDLYRHNDNANIVRGKVIHDAAHNCFVIGTASKTIALLGVDDLIVIDTPDATLITRRDTAHNVKKIITILEEQKDDTLL